MQRARQTRQKLERREAILAMALHTLEDTPFQDITMTQVAARVGLVKGTLYLYFETKEELFLEVLRAQFHAWFWDLEAGLALLPRRGRLAAAARLITDATASRPSFRRLLGVLHGNLEHNIPEEKQQAFKRELLSRTAATGSLLEKSLTGLATGQGIQLLSQIYALIIGLQAMTEPTAMTRKILEHQALAPLRLDFPQELRRGVWALMVGFKAEGKRGAAR